MVPIAWHKSYNHPLPSNHKFPMKKYDLLRDQLIAENIVKLSDFFEPKLIQTEDLLSVHSQNYIDKLEALALEKREERKMGFPQSDALIARERRIMEGTRQAADLALQHGLGFNIAGGTHHAFSDRPEGFCLYNDLAITASWLLRSKKSNGVLIIDLDVHQGNGTAEIMRDLAGVFTFSMHGESNYPLQKEVSDFDIGLRDGMNGDEYLNLLTEGLEKIDRSGFQFDFILYQCGADVLASDKFGRLRLEITDCALRDKMVYKFARGKAVPVVAVMGGGYSPDVNQVVEAHMNTFKAGIETIDI